MGLFLLIRLDSISLDHSVPILLDHYRTFQLTTKEDATFAGANVIADKINFDIGKDLNIISLQDESKSEGKSWGAGIDVSANIPGTNQKPGYATPSLNGSYSQDSADSKWVNNQTSIIAENGGSVKVGETLTNVGSIIGSLNSDEKLSIDANKVVVENLKDHDKGENSGIQVSGISKDTLIPQTGIQYGSHDKEQDSNATFVNTEVTEAGKKLDLEELGINTDINKAQVITKDEVVEQIDTVLHTDLGNQKVRDQFVEDILKTGSLVPEIVEGIKEGLNNDGQTVAGQIANNLIENKDDIHSFVTDRDNKQKEKNKELLDKNNGELSKELLDETTKFIKETLDAAGKGDYTVVYSEGGDDPAMSINDSKKIIVVNVDKTDFTDTEAIRQNAQHEGVHNRYVNEDADEKAAGSIYSGYDKSVDNKIPNDLKDLLTQGKELYDEGVANGEFRDKVPLSLADLTDIKNHESYKLAQSTLKKVCNSNVDCLANLYGFTEKEAYKAESKNNGDMAVVTVIEGIAIGLIPAGTIFNIGKIPITVSSIVGGGKTVIEIKGIYETISDREAVYPLIVAMIEEQRGELAFREFSKAQSILLGRVNGNNIDLNELKKFNENQKRNGLPVYTEKQIRDLKWRVENYRNTQNPDYFIAPRKTTTILDIRYKN